jgi:hypothetical protein
MKEFSVEWLAFSQQIIPICDKYYADETTAIRQNAEILKRAAPLTSEFLSLELLCFMVGSELSGTSNACKRVGAKDVFGFVLQHFDQAVSHEDLDARAERASEGKPIIIIHGNKMFIKIGSVYFDLSGLSFVNVVEIYFKCFDVFQINYTSQAYNLFFLFERICNVHGGFRVVVEKLYDRILNGLKNV